MNINKCATYLKKLITVILAKGKPLFLPMLLISLIISIEVLKNIFIRPYYAPLWIPILFFSRKYLKGSFIAVTLVILVISIKSPFLKLYLKEIKTLPTELFLEPISVKGHIIKSLPSTKPGSSEITIRGQLGNNKSIQNIKIYQSLQPGEELFFNYSEVKCMLDSSNLFSLGTNLSSILEVYRAETPFRFFPSNKTGEHYCRSDESPGANNHRDEVIKSLDPDARASLSLLYASCLGEGGQIEKWVNDLFKNTGLYHLLVVSGFHLGLLLILAHSITSILLYFYPQFLFHFPRSNIKAIVGIALTIFFLLVCETGKPLLRSAIVAFCMAFSVIFNRRQNIFVGLLWSLVILSLIYPLCIFEAGVQLSYGAILGVILGNRYANRFKKQDLEAELISQLELPISYKEHIKQFFIQSFFSSLGAFLIVSPIQYYWFQTFSLWSLPFNILFGAAFSYLVVLPGFFILAVIYICPTLGIGMLKIYSPVININIECINYLWKFVQG